MESPHLTPRAGRPQPLVDAPAFLFRWRWRLLLAALLTIPFFVPIPRVLQNDLIIGNLGDRLHVVLLGLAMLFFYWFGPLRGRLVGAVVAAAAMGGAIELLQQYVGRHMRWHDLGQDLIGIGIALGFVTWRGAGSRRGLALMVFLVLLVPWQMREVPRVHSAMKLAERRFPLLSDFETSTERWIWSDEFGGVLSYADAGPGHGGVQVLTAGPTEQYSAAIFHRFPSDWRGYRSLTFDARLATSDVASVRAGVVVTDYAGYRANHWLQMNFQATHEWRTVTLPLDGMIGRDLRPLRLDDMFLMKIYLSKPQTAVALEMDNLRLE